MRKGKEKGKGEGERNSIKGKVKRGEGTEDEKGK